MDAESQAGADYFRGWIEHYLACYMVMAEVNVAGEFGDGYVSALVNVIDHFTEVLDHEPFWRELGAGRS